MEILQNVFLRRQIRFFQLKFAFQQIKLLSNRTKNRQITSREVYLKYMQDVLFKKEQQLLELEKQLDQRHSYLQKKQLDQVMAQTFQDSATIQQIQLMLENLREQLIIPFLKSNQTHANKFIFQSFERKQQQILQKCKWKKQLSDSLIRDQYDQIAKQKKMLQQKISHFQSLESYQAYLGQLQEILQAKFRKNDLLNNDQSIQNSNCSHDNKNRRRVKIFQGKSELPLDHHTFGQSQSSIKQESSIKIQNQYPLQVSEQQSSKLKKKQQSQLKQHPTHIPNIPSKANKSFGTQVNQESAAQAWKRLKAERLKVKFITLWLKYSADGKGNTDHKKSMILFQWRMNACFDQEAPYKINGHLSLMDKQWSSRSQILKSQKLFPYLSIKRKKYLQLFLDYERRLLHHKSQFILLSSICRNKNRKQRLAFLLYFKKWQKNAFIQTNKSLKQQTSATNMYNRSQQIATSGPFSRSSSQIMNEQRVQKSKVQKKSTQKQKSQIIQSRLTQKNQSQKALKGKQNEVIGQGANLSQVDIKKLKLYIRQKQEIQKLLAIQYLRSQSSSKLAFFIHQKLNQFYNSFFTNMKLTQRQFQNRQIQSQLQQNKFKWELFMTKCRLALTNNSNKINYLEQILCHPILDK